MTELIRKVPKEMGFIMPAEFEEHEGTILIWPVRPGSWTNGGADVQPTFLQIAVNIAKAEKVYFCSNEENYSWMKEEIDAFISSCEGEKEPDEIKIIRKNIIPMILDSDDAWARDIGPTFVKDEDGRLRAINWRFNAWGGLYNGLYSSWEKDNAFALAFAEKTGYETFDGEDFVLEGGAIHVDGEGTCVVTEECLLSPGRNPDMTKEEIEKRLMEMLGVTKVIWLPYGIYNDETDQHIDNVFAFVKPGAAVLAWTDDKDDPQYEMSLADLKVLEEARDAKGRKIEITKIRIPKVPVTITEEEMRSLMPDEGEDEREVGERLAASYVNFYIANSCVLVPSFGEGNEETDREAFEKLSCLFKDRPVVMIPARKIIVGGGNIHCITQQIPKGVR
ncbi:MAG: agmatine deiminase [Eubacterium sp.]|nr:agmatine deiminase [Eubacterium sp.]